MTPDKDKIEKGIKLVLEGLGLDLNDPHLKATPERVARAYIQDFCKGYYIDPASVLNRKSVV